jgi:hypothetical protein
VNQFRPESVNGLQKFKPMADYAVLSTTTFRFNTLESLPIRPLSRGWLYIYPRNHPLSGPSPPVWTMPLCLCAGTASDCLFMMMALGACGWE